MRIYISGLYSGTNPQPGVGIARSLRAAYPEAILIGVEYSNRCSGIHWQDFDEIRLQRPWDELDLEAYAAELGKVLDDGSLFISANDLEILWLGSVFPDGHPNLLTPPLGSLKKVAKPAIEAHYDLPVKIPAFTTTELSDWELHAFCRRHDWKVWLKGPYYEAVRTRNWSEFESVREILSGAWSTDTLFLQSHVSGYEESVALSAYQGELLHCVRMRKRDLTEISKTWAGDVTEVPENISAPLRKIVRDLNWTGGAELEMVRAADDNLWLLEWNPRYPAWIHGATIAGHNLLGRLIEGATGVKAQEVSAFGEEFTRVVVEIPVRQEFSLPPMPEPLANRIGHSLKHPSGLLGFANRLHTLKPSNYNDGNGNELHKSTVAKAHDIPHSFIEDLSVFNFTEVQTPSFLFLEKTANRGFQHAASMIEKFDATKLNIKNAYSMKTNPDARLLQKALENGFFIETISPLEINKALEIGFNSELVILNGPGKWWKPELLPKTPLHAVFCNSIADLQRIAAHLKSGELQTKVAGVRLRTPNISSRFGIPVDSPEVFRDLLDSIRLLPLDCAFGAHFHMASSNVGVHQWRQLFRSMLRWCASIETLSGRKIECLDIGGGWFPDDWHEDFDFNLKKELENIREHLPHVKEIISEPGKALAQPSMALAMRILEAQKFSSGNHEIVVDGSIAELPMYFHFPHRILHRNPITGKFQSVGRGKTKLFGRLCMEHDIVAANVELPETAEVGDVLIFCDAGAYDRSMSYVFGRG